MKINISKKNTIKNYTDWFCVAPPKGGKDQWKEGRSALELARFATSSDFNKMITELLKELNLKTDQEFECEPEAETYFPVEKMGKSGPRNHDLLMIGEDCVIGVEAKVSEPFAEKMSEKRKGASENMELRLNGAIKYIYGDKVPKNVEDLKYQLFSATIGTIEEARKADKKNAITLVIVFTGDVDKEKNYTDNVNCNKADYCAFVETLSLDSDYHFKVADPDAADINCYIKKVEIDIKKTITYNFQ